MLEQLKQQVCEANLQLVREKLVIDTWGNVSGIDRKAGLVVIKPSGVPYDGMKGEHMVVVSLATGEVVEGKLKPSSDTPTHLEIYRAFGAVGGVVHTHSLYATVWAQARRDLPALGTTHADYFYGPVPCTRCMTPGEIDGDYEANTGKIIIERFKGLDPMQMQAVLVCQHGPFTWGASPDKAVKNAVVLEHLALMAAETLKISPHLTAMDAPLLDKHFLRKHGSGAYYGQK